MKRYLFVIIVMLLCNSLTLHVAVALAADNSIGLSLKQDSLLLAGGVLLYAAGHVVSENAPTPNAGSANRDDVWFAERFVVDKYSVDYIPWSDRTRNITLLLPVIAAIPSFIESDTPIHTAATHAVITLETLLFAGGVTNLTKGIVQRKRPYYFNPDESEYRRASRDANLSFWSGHAVVAFAAAVNAAVMFEEHSPGSRWVKPLWIGGLSIAGVGAALQVASGDHFPTDIIAAAAAGSFAGWCIPRLHRNFSDDDKPWKAVFTGNGLAIVF